MAFPAPGFNPGATAGPGRDDDTSIDAPNPGTRPQNTDPAATVRKPRDRSRPLDPPNQPPGQAPAILVLAGTFTRPEGTAASDTGDGSTGKVRRNQV